MKFFRNPVTAIILAFLIVAGSTLINVHWKFGAMCREIQDSFYETDRIGNQLEAIRQDAVLLSSVAKQNGIDAEDLRSAADDLQSALSRESTGAGLLFWYYDTLRTELISTEQRLLSATLPEADAETVRDCMDRISAASDRISGDPYNQTVRAFLSKYDRFPTGPLAILADVDMPEVFA